MVILALPLLLIGIALLVLGLRGRAMGDDPHCRRCGFNLRGRDPSQADPRCPECGAALNEKTIRTGFRRRRPVLLASGMLLTVVSLAAIGLVGVMFAREYDFNRWKPTSWLIEDLDGGDTSVAAELMRRAADPAFGQAKLDALIDHILARQADRSKSFGNDYADIVDAAAARNRIDLPRLQRYLRQGVGGSIGIKPKIRRGQPLTLAVALRFDRCRSGTQFFGTFKVMPLKFDDKVVYDRWPQSVVKPRQMGGTYSSSASIDPRELKLDNVADGKHQATASIVLRLSTNEPNSKGSVMWELPLTAPVEICPAGAIVDEFKTDPERREEMRKAILAARVKHDEQNHVDARLKFGPFPVPIAASVVLTQGGASQKIGQLLIDAGKPPHCVKIYSWQKPRFTGAVDIHLQPDQAAADGQRVLATYWGEEIVIPNITVDAKYDPPFVKDESLRPAVEKSLIVPRLRRIGGDSPIDVTVEAHGPPIKLVYHILLVRDGRETLAGHGPVVFNVGGNNSYGTSSPDVDPAHKAATCDVILRPSRDWETSSSDLTPPWAGEVVFHDVKIESTK